MTFKYSVLLKARFGGPFVLSENTRLLLYMPYAEMTFPIHFTLLFSVPARNMS